MPGTLFVVATPIGNLEDITARALRVLREVSLIAAEDTRHTARLLARYAITTPTTSLHAHNEHRKSTSLVERLKRGESVALVSDAGTPTVSDPGASLIAAAVDAGIRVEPIPGPNAAVTALAVSGFQTDRFTFLGFPPTRSTLRSEWFDRLRNADGTVVFYEAPHRLLATLQEVRAHVGNCRICIARELTKTHEELVRGPIDSVLSSPPNARGEFTVVAEIGRITDNDRPAPLKPPDILAEFGRMTHSGGVSRRRAISALARKVGRPVNEIYKVLEDAKKSGQ